jgi:hypothetical protein
MKNVYDITNEFEKRVAEYTGAPYVVVLKVLSGYCFCISKTTLPASECPTNDVILWSGYNASFCFNALSAFIYIY